MADNPLAVLGSSLRGWWRPDQGLNRTGAVVTSINDQSGNGATMTAIGSPAYGDTIHSGGPGVKLSGSTMAFITAVGAIATGGATQLGVWSAAAMDAGCDAYGRLASLENAPISTDDWNDPNGGVPLMRDGANNNITMNQGGGFATPVPITLGRPYHFSSIWDGANHNMRLDNGAPTSQAWTPTFAAALTMSIGVHLITNASGVAASANLEYFNGIWGETFIATGPFTAGQLAALEEWMRLRQEHVAPGPFFVSAGAVASGIGTVTPGVPPVYRDNDIFLLFVEHANQPVATPSGWNTVTNGSQGSGTAGGTSAAGLQVFWKLASGVLTAPTVADAGDHTGAIIHVYRNARLSGNPWDITAGAVAATSTAISFPAVTTTVPNTLIVNAIGSMVDVAGARLSGAAANSNLLDVTTRSDDSYIDGNGGGIAVVSGLKATAGASGNTTATLATTSVQAMVTIALAPSVASAVPSMLVRPYLHGLMR